MKTTFKTLVCALALSTTVAFAGPGSDAKKPTTFEAGIYKNTEGNLRVNFEKKSFSNASVAILNTNGDVLARENLSRKQNKAAWEFNLSALQDGEYTLRIVSKGEKIEKQFTIDSVESVEMRQLVFE